jgi:protoporphyrinogen oxidase
MSVVGGNWKIFNEMIIASGAQVSLNNPVTSIERTERPGRSTWRVTFKDGCQTFDGVVLATPYVFSQFTTSENSIYPISQ